MVENHPDWFDFSCAVNLEDGVVRSVDVQSTDVGGGKLLGAERR